MRGTCGHQGGYGSRRRHSALAALRRDLAHRDDAGRQIFNAIQIRIAVYKLRSRHRSLSFHLCRPYLRQARVASPHIRRGLLDATRHLRKLGGCDTKINEYYLFHGLGDPTKAVNIFGAGMNEHFSGVNAGTMFRV